jgi:hypothetical protein
MLRLILIGGVVAVLAGCATAPQSASTAGGAVAPQSQLPPCTPDATRIPDKNCGPGRTWDQNAIKSTGQSQPGAALNMLDPALVGH